jgi:hypothetical protein
MAAVLVGTLIGPMAVAAEDQGLAMAPSVPSWDDASGYGSIEAIRAGIDLRSSDGPFVQVARPARDIGSLQEEYFAARTMTAASWDETSGYHSVESSRSTASPLLTSSEC